MTHHCRLCALAPTGAFEFFGAKEIEVIYAVVSASNNCEMCLSFHAAALGMDSQHTALSFTHPHATRTSTHPRQPAHAPSPYLPSPY